MDYSVLFFALSGDKFAKQLADPSEKLLKKARRGLARKLKSDPEALESIESAAEAICRGEVPDEAPQEYFDALYTLVDAAGERIDLGTFQFGTCLYLEACGIWPWTQQETPPFPLPTTRFPPPEFGFLPRSFMADVVLPGITDLPPNDDVQLARNQFSEVVESVVADNLDLVAYYSVW